MVIKSKTLFLILLSLYLLLTIPFGYSMTNDQNGSIKMTQQEYENALRKQNMIHGFIRTARTFEKKGQHERALENYLEAYNINQCASLIAVCRGAMAENYEAIGQYDEALQHVNWFLDGLNKDEPSWYRYTEMRQRLLKKIAEQKNGHPQTPSSNDGSNGSLLTQQLKAANSLSDEGVKGVLKRALLAESVGNDKEALDLYFSLLPQRYPVSEAFNEAQWVMLHPAVQRTAERVGDERREKTVLSWIKLNMINPTGIYHEELQYLAPPVVKHLEERVNYYRQQDSNFAKG